jgi:hypothetical protein
MPCRYISPNAVTPYSIAIAVSRSSSNMLPVAYAMMESHMDMEAEHQVNPVDAGIFYKTRTQLQLSEEREERQCLSAKP